MGLSDNLLKPGVMRELTKDEKYSLLQSVGLS
jgi:hypothetical protein